MKQVIRKIILFIVVNASLFILGCEPAKNSRITLIDGSPFPEDLDGLMKVKNHWDTQFYSKEILARKVDGVLTGLWDALKRSGYDLNTILTDIQGTSFSYPESLKPALVLNTIRFHESVEAISMTNEVSLIKWIQEQMDAGWKLDLFEIRHYNLTQSQNRTVSGIYGFLMLKNSIDAKKISIYFEAEIHWPESGIQFQGSRLRVLKTRFSEAMDSQPFSALMMRDVRPMRPATLIGPLIVKDLNDDGYPEICLPGANVVYWNNNGKGYTSEELVRFKRPSAPAAIILPLNDTSKLDLIIADPSGLWKYSSNSSFRFVSPPELIWKAPTPLKGAFVLAAGDYDNDRKVDIYVAQYKPPFDGGQMPDPIYDALDGEPAYLLKQNANGNFSDVTIESGLATTRSRRTFASSFVDLDEDGFLDLIVTSDFAGLDIHWNNGDGTFDTQESGKSPDRMALGMSHIVFDSNKNGMPEIFMAGMNVPVVDRLLSSSQFPTQNTNWISNVKKLTRGNQWLEIQKDREIRSMESQVNWKKTGWTWGVAELDVFNGGQSDLYIVNGHESSASTLDYETFFWSYDIHFAHSVTNSVSDSYFKQAMKFTRGGAMSYGGNEINRLLVQNPQGRTHFHELGYLLGVSMPQDCRSVVAADIDLDGKQDLILTTFEIFPKLSQKVIVFKNQTPSKSWMGIHLPVHYQIPGTKISLHSQSNPHHHTTWEMIGDSFHSQSPSSHSIGINESHEPYTWRIQVVGEDPVNINGKRNEYLKVLK